MAGYNVSVPHNLGQAAARDRVEQFLNRMRADYGEQITSAEGQWNDATLDFNIVSMGITVSGQMVVEDTLIRVSGPLPMIASFFKGKIEEIISHELRRLIETDPSETDAAQDPPA